MKILMVGDTITIALSKPEARVVREALVLSADHEAGSTCHEIIRQITICLDTAGSECWAPGGVR